MGNNGGPAYHFCSFGTSDGELKVGIFLPVSEQEWELGQEAIVGVPDGVNGLGVRVAINTAL